MKERKVFTCRMNATKLLLKKEYYSVVKGCAGEGFDKTREHNFEHFYLLTTMGLVERNSNRKKFSVKLKYVGEALRADVNSTNRANSEALDNLSTSAEILSIEKSRNTIAEAKCHVFEVYVFFQIVSLEKFNLSFFTIGQFCYHYRKIIKVNKANFLGATNFA